MSNLTEKKAPTLRIESNYIGYLETKYLFSYTDAVNHLHENLAIRGNWEWMLKEYPKATYSVWIMTGKFDKYDDEIIEKVYSITSAKIRKMLKLGIIL
jgi:hypothetical protein